MIKLRLLITILLFSTSVSKADEIAEPLIENGAKHINFNYNNEKPIPSALPEIPINEETKLQYTLSVEDLRKIATISVENDWKTIIEELTSYQDSLLINRKKVSLEEALSIAFKQNPEIKENKYDVLASIWRVRAEARRWMPTISLDSGNLGYYKEELYVNSRNPENPSLGSGSASSYQSDYFQAYPEATISWNAFDPQRGPSIMLEKRSEERNKLLLNYSIRSLVVEVYKSYTDIEILLEQINAYSELVALEVSIADAIYEVYEKGMTSIGEVTKWRGQTYSSISELIGYYQRLNSAYSKFSSVLGSNDYYPIIPNGKTIKVRQWPLTMEESINKAELENERIKGEYIDSQMSELKAQKLINSYLPTLTLGASAANSVINGVYQAPSYQSAPILPTTNQHTTNPIYQIYAGITMNFDGGINMARAKSEEMNAKAKLYNANRINSEVIKNVRDYYNGINNQTLSLKSTEKSVKNSKISLDVYKQRFMAGLSDTTPFLQAVDLYTKSIITRSNVKAKVVSDYVNLLRATATWPKEFEVSLDKTIEMIMNTIDH